ncbi:orotate phosphoribosyltransferase [uncultured Ferrovibrio sp.]|jgi:orotate phosphoribosyltransferase|uniref:orotate phosphoribosyltransferase n=1 Tax=uncultured Ferrovibrio sp. TaxID=1576913 RepID=UPI002631BCC0|nr:orotate phosphoribosyltransferase [uncultured Ferrovibrio sp.]
MDKATIAAQTARILLRIGAVKYNPVQPFFFTSGWASPIYIECRKLISYPDLRRQVMDFALQRLRDEMPPGGLDVVAGGESAGIPFAAWLADRLDLPMVYIRKRPIGLGPNAQMEGDFAPGARVLLVEDLTTDARSKVNFCAALRQASAVVSHVFVIFGYDIFPGTKELLQQQELALISLANCKDVLQVARSDEYFDKATLDAITTFLDDPVGWSASHGGIGAPPAGGMPVSRN